MEQSFASDFHFSSPGADGNQVDDADLMADIHGSSAYRANLVKVMAKRAVTAAG